MTAQERIPSVKDKYISHKYNRAVGAAARKEGVNGCIQ